jgi:hypothetical protein
LTCGRSRLFIRLPACRRSPATRQMTGYGE